MLSEIEYEPWYRYGIGFLYLEMAIAIQVTLIALLMTFTGTVVDKFILITSILIITFSIGVLIILVNIIRNRRNN